MKSKTAVKGTATVEIHTRPTLHSEDPGRISPPSIRPDFDPQTTPVSILLTGTARLPEDTRADAILPAPPVVIGEPAPQSRAALSIPSTPTPPTLASYLVTRVAHLPKANAQGLREFKGRQYANLADGGVVPIGIDSRTGLYRARLLTEQLPSGPVMANDPATGHWHPRNDLESIIFPLSDTRLEAFRSELDFSNVEPDSDGIIHHNGRLYAAINDHTYQLLHDLEASSPQISVMRIVRGEDPIAVDENNIFVATRPGRSEPVVLDPRDGWMGVHVAGQGGMRRNEREHPVRQSLIARFAAFVNRSSPPETRIRKLFPNFNDAQTTAYLQSLGDDAARELTLKEAEYKTLKKDLLNWTGINGRIADSQASLVAQSIKRCWRQETEAQLKLPAAGLALPALKADFSHVRVLELDSVTWAGTADTFLHGFTGLEHLVLTRCGLQQLPAKIGEMHNLRVLDLSANNLRLDDSSASKLSALHRLEELNLAKNPLDVLPDFSRMPRLKALDLAQTGLREWPTGLQSQVPWVKLDLSSNRLTAVPLTILDPAPERLAAVAQINSITVLSGNEFPAGYSSHFDNYWRRLRTFQPEWAATVHSESFDLEGSAAQRYRRLYPRQSIEQCRHYIYGLDQEIANARLTNLEQEFNSLKSQLDAWVFCGGGERQRYVRANQIQLNATSRDDRYLARDRIVACWRRETPQKLAHDQTPIGLELDLSGLRLPSLPDIDVDFNHVGSLNLSNMNLSASPEGFLTRFRHVRWLNLSRNQLRELPPAIGEMNAMTRLFLASNQITLTPETALVLEGRTTLRALSLSFNPQLRLTPDFSQMTDMRSLHMANSGIESFPTGLSDQPLLDRIELSNNQISHIPESVIEPSDERLIQSVRVNNVTSLRNNPLSEETLSRLDAYEQRLVAAGTLLTGDGNLLRTALHSRSSGFPSSGTHRGDDSMARWTAGLSPAQVADRRVQWQLLRNQQGCDGLFETLDRLLQTPTGHEELQRRVWRVIDSITENTPESDNLRKELFDRAGEAACCDRAAFTFANLETQTLVHNARVQARDQAQGPQLSALSRGLFRLHEVDKIASADIARREQNIRSSRPRQSVHNPEEHLVSEEVEIRLAYRYGLKDKLQLPGQPDKAPFIHLAGVTQEHLDSAYKTVKALDDSPEEFQALISREFWQEFITNKYRTQFEAQRQPYQDQQALLDESYARKQIERSEYEAQAKTVQNSLAIDEAAMIETLTRQELSERAETAVSDSTAVEGPSTST